MRFVIIVSHGEFAYGMHSAIRMMTGNRDEVISLGLLDNMTADQFYDELKEKLKSVKKEDEVIVLADIEGGSPYVNAIRVLQEKKMKTSSLVVAGANLPVALRTVLTKDVALKDLKDILNREGILNYQYIA